MTVESVTYINDLNPTNPAGTDAKSEGDNHIRNTKTGIKNSFPNIDGAMTSTQAELNTLDGYTGNTADFNILSGADAAGLTATELQYVKGVTSDIQNQINAKAAINSQTFTGTPSLPTGTTASTQSAGNNSTKLATTAYTDAAISALSGTWVEIDSEVITTADTNINIDGMDDSIYSRYIIEGFGLGRSGSGGNLFIQYKIGGAEQGQQTVGALTTSASLISPTEFYNDVTHGNGGGMSISVSGIGSYSVSQLSSDVSGFRLYTVSSGPFINGGYIRLLGLKK